MPKKNTRKDPKSAALLENGTMNPSPGKVTDPKFYKSDFFDARDLVQVKYEMLRRVFAESVSVTDASVEYGVVDEAGTRERREHQASVRAACSSGRPRLG